MLPFTHDQFLRVFAEYNGAVWPAPVAAYAAAAAICIAIASRRTFAPALASGGLAAMWLFTGIAYHGVFFMRVNPAAGAFALAFIVQAALLTLCALRGSLEFPISGGRGMRNVAGWLLIAYSTLLYPAIGELSGVRYPSAPVFGITPCPLVIFTLGVFILARSSPWWLLPIPMAWAAIGASAAWQLSIPQDWALPVSAAAVLALSWLNRRGAATLG